MVELLEQPGPRIVDDREVDDPAGRRVDGTAQRDLDPVAVAVHARTFVSSRHAGQMVRGFEGEDFFEIN
jgi:hypothetical protein